MNRQSMNLRHLTRRMTPSRGRVLLSCALALVSLAAASNALLLPVRLEAAPHAAAAASAAASTTSGSAIASATTTAARAARISVPSSAPRAPRTSALAYASLAAGAAAPMSAAPMSAAPMSTRTMPSDAVHAGAAQAANNAIVVHPVRTQASAASPAPTAADLAQSDEVQLTAAIRAQATALGNNPVAIYNFVRDHIAYAPTYGSIQGAQATLDTGRGNDIDTASLTIALLRAAGTPARYAYGTVEVPAALAQNWVGGVATPEAAVALFAQGGVPVQGIVAGGHIASLQIEHVWVEAYVDFYPSRGAINRNPSTWVPIDASFKQLRYSAPMALGVTVDGAGLASGLRQGATVAADRVTALSAGAVAQAYTDYATRSANAVVGQNGNATVGDVLGSASIVGEGLPMLAGALPYKTVAFGARYAALPDSLRWQVQVGLYATAYDRSQGMAIVGQTASLPALAGHALVIGFAPKTAADATRLQGLINANPLPASIAATGVQLSAQLAVDGGIVTTAGDNLVPGTPLLTGVAVFDPHVGDWTALPASPAIAGETHAFAFVGTGVSQAMLAAARAGLTAQKTALASHQYSGLTDVGLTGALLYDAALAYAATSGGTADLVGRDLMGRSSPVVGTALPGIVHVQTQASSTLVGGVAQSVSFKGIALTVERLSRSAVAADNSAGPAQTFQRVFGERAGAYAHLILEAFFANAGDRAASAVRVIDTANSAGQANVGVTQASAGTLTTLGLDAATLAQAQAAAQAGDTVTVPQGAVAVGAWSGSGDLSDDPATGALDAQVAGGPAAVLINAGGNTALALAAEGLAVQADAVSASVTAAITAQVDYAAAAIALVADAHSAPWSTWLGNATVVGDAFLSAMWTTLPAPLGQPGTTVATVIATDTLTTLPHPPQPNNPPVFTSTPTVNAAVGQAYQYLATATDPDGDLLTFSLVAGPSGMSVAAGGLVSWPAPIAGDFPVTVRVSDGRANVDQHYTLSVGPVLALDLALGITPQFVNDGDVVTITVATTGGSGQVTKTLSVDGSTVALDANGQAHVTAHGAGGHPVVATAHDAQSTLTRQGAFGVHVDADTTPPTVAITAPADGATLSAPTQVTGTVNDANLLFWQLLVSPTGLGQYRELARGTQNVNGALGTFDPTLLANGQYDLALIAYDANGAQASQKIEVLVYGDLKLGQFTVSFNDLQLDVGGIPLTIIRTYDSRKKDQLGDFGYGWSLGYQNIALQRNKPLGENWEIYQPGFLTFCIRPVGKRTVSIVMADGKVHQFDIDDSANCDTGQVPEVFTLAFTPRAGTTSTLEALDAADLLFQGNTVYDSDTGDAFDSVQYRLTTLENYQYILTSSDGARTFQVVQITDPNGQTLTLSQSGVTSSIGAAIQFNRDAQGRIIQVADPSGRTVTYTYTAAGDLDAITSPLNQVSRNQYATVPASLAHLLTTWTDASGTQQLRNEYDATGRLIAQYDALGNKVDLSQRSVDTHTQAVTDRNGHTTTYTFDDAGNITKVIDAAGNVSTATFDTYGNQTSQTDALGRTTRTSYDAPSGTVTGSTDALGHSTTQAWNFYTMLGNHTPQNLQSTTDELGHTTNYAYTSPGMLNVITDPLGASTRFGWGGSNFDQLAGMTDATGHTTSYVNDAQGRKIQETDPLGNITKYTYDDAGHLLTTTKSRVTPGGIETLVSSQSVDADGNVLAQTDALGNTTQNTWTTQKQLATQTDPLGRVTKYAYDAAGRATQTTYPDGRSEATAFDPNGNETRQTDRAGRSTTTAYDALNRPTTVTNPDGSTTVSSYDAAGQLTASTDELGRATTSAYDAGGHKTGNTDALGHTTTYAYDAAGKVTTTTDALNRAVTYGYDAANRKTQTTWPDGSISGFGYDAVGRKTQDTDPAGRVTQYGYDANGRLNQVTDALGKITTYGYDELGNKVQQTDALGHGTQWGYDALSRPTSRTLPDARYETMAYDAAGRLTNRTDFGGNATGYQYDNADRLTRALYNDGLTIATSYTAADQVASLTQTPAGQPSQITTYGYDARDRLVDQKNADAARAHYVYDAAGQKTSQTITTPDGQGVTTTYTWDAAGNLLSVTENGKTTTFTYDDANEKTSRTAPNGQVTTYSYDANGRLTGWLTKQSSAANAAVFEQGTYTLNAAGQRTQLVYVSPDGQSRTIGYSYDGAGRLTGETRTQPALSLTWVLDAVGNRTSQTRNGQTDSYTYDVADRLTAISGANPASFTWDTNGQLATRTDGSGSNAKTTTYSFDARHELIGATLPDGTKIVYLYQADGNLASRTKTLPDGSSTTTHYVVDTTQPFAQVVAEYDDAGHATARYTYGGELLMRTRAGQATYYEHDGLGTVHALSDDSGSAIASYGYDAWGNLVESSGTDDNPYQYTGERYDADLGLVYLRARWYDPRIGRFIAPDEMSGSPKVPVTLNKYVYASANPIDASDPSGMETLGDIGAGLDIEGILGNIAKDQISSFVQNQIFGCPDVDNGQPCLYEVLVSQLFEALAGSFSSDASKAVVLGAALAGGGGGGRNNGHHVIPRYMCGAEKQVDLANLSRKEHDKLHAELYEFETVVRSASVVYNLLFRKKRPSDILASPIAQVSRTAQGRAAIVVGLGIFYDSFGYNGAPWSALGRGQRTLLPIGGILALEAPRYISYNHSTVGSCKNIKFI